MTKTMNGHLAPCVLPDRKLPNRPFLELTQVLTAWTYGAPTTATQFAQEMNDELKRNWLRWNDPHGPEWLEP